MDIEQRIASFLQAPAFGVVGASAKRHKYGNKVLRCYLQNNHKAIPVNPVEANIEKGIRNIWMQPGAESPQAVQACEEAGINVIADGSCLLVVLGYHEH